VIPAASISPLNITQSHFETVDTKEAVHNQRCYLLLTV